MVAVVAPWRAPAPADAQTGSDRLILEPADPDTIFTVQGLYPQPSDNVCQAKRRLPLQAKYRGRLELVLDSDGEIELINQLSFSHYLRGLAEVPTSWPAAALRAQVIAARSYGLYHYRQGLSGAGARGYHICATDQCQVYRGATIELGAFGDRWVDAVESTRGEVLTYDGDVIQAFYFSTSDGRTRSSFPGGTAQAWLPSVDGEDHDAPLARWVARFPVDDLAAIFRAHTHDGVPIWRGNITGAQRSGGTIAISGSSDQAEQSLSDFRHTINAEAACLFPNRYPNPTGTQSGGRLPQAVPSTSFSLRVRDGAVVLRGSGWGHYVGMSQWGANSLAERGRGHGDILKHYYGPAELTRFDEPGSIRVLAAEGLRRIRIEVDGPVRVRTGNGGRLAPGNTFEVRGGRALEIRRGIGPRLRTILDLRARSRAVEATEGEPVGLRFEASRSAVISVRVTDANGAPVRTLQDLSYTSGPHRVRVATRADPLPAGAYTAVIVAYDGLDRVRSQPIPITILPAADVAPTDEGPGAGETSRALPIGIAILALVGAALLGVFWRRSFRSSQHV